VKKYKCLIIDDDPLITDLVLHYSEKCELIEYCISCNDPVEGLKLLVNSHVDILFLDYNMPKLNGKDLLDLKRDNSKVIMITSNTEFAVTSYQYDAIQNYLVKPINYDDFYNAVDKIYKKEVDESIIKEPEIDESSILIKNGSDWVPMLFKNIEYIKSESNYCTFISKSSKTMSLISLKSLEDKLPSNFIRCHRSYIVNMDFVKSFNLELIKIDETIIPISALYREKIKTYIKDKS
jgi:DNA-binding LytR/AlgR family response regulator